MLRPLKVSGKDLFIILIILAAFYLQHLFSMHLGINFEEGRDANAYLLAMQGYKPYRDFEWVYGPLSFFIYPPIMKIFGVNLLVLRISYVIFASFVIPLTYFLAREIMPPIWAGLASFLAITLFDVPYYTYNHIFAVLGELSCLLMIVKAVQKNKYTASLLGASLFAAITLLTKPFFSGVNLFFSVFLFLIILKATRRAPLKFANIILLFFGPAFLITALFIFFYLGRDAIKDYFLENTPFSSNPVGQIYNVGGAGLVTIITRLTRRFLGLFPVSQILDGGLFSGFKRIMVDWFDNFIFYLPFLTAAAILIIYKVFARTNKEVQKIFQSHKMAILLFTVFSVIISTENLAVAHRMSRAFNIQAAFILFVFCCFLLFNIAAGRNKAIVFFLSILFIFLFSFLHFFRYPWSRSKEFTRPLNLGRASGIYVTAAEKELYESLSSYLSRNFNEDEKVAVLGYNPQFTFLTKRKNVFAGEEGIFLKFEYLPKLAQKDARMLGRLKLLEQDIINQMELQKPKAVLDVIFEGCVPLYKNAVGDFIRKNYRLAQTFGPANIQGIKEGSAGLGRVDLYMLKGQQ